MTSSGEADLCECPWDAASCNLGMLGDPRCGPAGCPGVHRAARVCFAEGLMEHSWGRAVMPGDILGFLPHVSSIPEVLGMAGCKTSPGITAGGLWDEFWHRDLAGVWGWERGVQHQHEPGWQRGWSCAPAPCQGWQRPGAPRGEMQEEISRSRMTPRSRTAASQPRGWGPSAPVLLGCCCSTAKKPPLGGSEGAGGAQGRAVRCLPAAAPTPETLLRSGGQGRWFFYPPPPQAEGGFAQEQPPCGAGHGAGWAAVAAPRS